MHKVIAFLLVSNMALFSIPLTPAQTADTTGSVSSTTTTSSQAESAKEKDKNKDNKSPEASR